MFRKLAKENKSEWRPSASETPVTDVSFNLSLTWFNPNYTWCEPRSTSGGTDYNSQRLLIKSFAASSQTSQQDKCWCTCPDWWEEVAWEQSGSSRWPRDGSKPRRSDSCWFVFLHPPHSFTHRKIIYPIYFPSLSRRPQCWAHGENSEVMKAVLLKSCSPR